MRTGRLSTASGPWWRCWTVPRWPRSLAGTSRQSLHPWLRRFREGGRDGLKDRSRRPHSSPSRVPTEVAVCQLRQSYPKWGARRIAHELAVRGVANAPGRSTVHRILVRNGLVNQQVQIHRRVYKRSGRRRCSCGRWT
ncbi:helix-turn-helix domain-containing protein [Streptomyces chartreusis]|uniref:helix-turn-helix domain-containing protein n=1 Tax=Streptomyces chartreusis TaxID=1969 RepID=UPI0038097C00